MNFETREQVMEKVMTMDKPKCPHCQAEMNIWETPSMTFGDGLGWGTPYLFVCFNDECSLYQQGWDHIQENFAHTASYRCMNYPGTDQYEVIPVFSPVGGTGQIILCAPGQERQPADSALKRRELADAADAL